MISTLPVEDQEQIVTLNIHREQLLQCRKCPNMCSTPVPGPAVYSKVLLVGQAPGIHEPTLGRPFAWTAGKTLFTWLSVTGLSEEEIRSKVYFSAVCRCFPGKAPSGGDRAPMTTEIHNCTEWLDAEINNLQPKLVIAVGKLAISQFTQCGKLDTVIGKFHKSLRAPGADVLPLPHPSGASTWIHTPSGKLLLKSSLELLAEHPAIANLKVNQRL